jgi:hypothetical protein
MSTLAYFVRVGIVKKIIFYIFWLKESAIKVSASAPVANAVNPFSIMIYEFS